MKILVIEDNDKNRWLLCDILRYHKHEVIEAANGEEGIEAARLHKPSLILMDMQMPVMDGFTATKILKSDPQTCSIKIIAVTSFAMTGDRQKVMESGVDDYVSKPVDTRALPDLVKKYCTSGGV